MIGWKFSFGGFGAIDGRGDGVEFGRVRTAHVQRRAERHRQRAQLGVASDILCVCVVDDAGVDDVLRGPDGAATAMADGSVVAGAMTRHRFFETSALIRDRLPLLHHAMALVAHVAVRNRGTLGGSLCYSDPSAEWPALCLACNAQMVLQGTRGVRRLGARDFLVNLFTTALAPNEILTEVVFPAWPRNRRWGFQEVSRRKGDFAIVGVACLLDIEDSGLCEDARRRFPAAYGYG